ncbi:MAG: NAD(P)/FAD-dependent oxidoreductase [Vicinamibacterales bacterium]
MSDAAIDVVVIGAGVTGLAAALAIASRGHSTAVVEQHARAGMETSTHNSGVIHAGLYYPTGTLKAELCVEGASRLYRFCAEHGVPHDRCGKLVVAVEDHEIPTIEAITTLGAANGAEDLDVVGPDFIHQREPHVRARAALWSPHTGRVEAEALVRTLQRLGEAAGAILLRQARVVGGERRPNAAFEIRTERETIEARVIVNAAGLYADDISATFGGEPYRIYACRGEYAELKRHRRHWLNGLVYPLPEPSGHGLGTHLTRTTGGAVLLGPTATYQERKDDYEGDRLPIDAFLEPTRRLIPEVTLDDLTYGGSGIRPKLHPASERFADFMVRPDRSVPTLIHAAGIDSPGLTSCLAIAARLGPMVDEALRHA